MGGGGGGPSNFIVNQSPNPWILGFEILDLDFRLDNNLELYQHYSSNSIHFIEKYLILSATCVTSLTWKCVPIVQPSTSGDRWSIC